MSRHYHNDLPGEEDKVNRLLWFGCGVFLFLCTVFAVLNLIAMLAEG